jgi:chitinase
MSTTEPQAQLPVLAAYTMDRGVTRITPQHAAHLTHVNYAFGLVKDGAVVVDHLRHADHLAGLRHHANPALQLVLSVGGWGAGGFSEAASTEAGRVRFAETAVASMQALDFDGIDIDWEYPCIDSAGIAASPSDKANFTALIATLRERLDSIDAASGHHHLLTIAAGAGAYWVESTEMRLVHPYLDFVNLMTYDMRGSFQNATGHHTNLYPQTGDAGGPSAVLSVRTFEEAGVPRGKLVLGAAFYGRAWRGVEGGPSEAGAEGIADTRLPALGAQSAGGGGEYHRFNDITAKLAGTDGYRRYWDPMANAPYLYNGDVFISYDDEESLAAKGRYVLAEGLRGAMFWEFSEDTSGRLLRALAAGLGR